MITWKLNPEPPKEVTEQFPELSRVVVHLLYSRGLTDPVAIEQFLSPDYKNLHSPFLFQDMDKAVARTWQAIENKETIFIYGDYDADAVTANAVLQQTFRYLGVEAKSYIPDRFSEGYGLNVEAFEKIKAQGATLVITVDCGTNSVDVADFCRANGIDLIITDHHEITGATPEAFALINPKNPSDKYPDNQITGVGVAYKFAKALLSNKDKVIAVKNIPASEYLEEWDKWLLDLVAIGTVADCHSLMGENRILVKFGLRVLPKTKWIGLRQLAENSGLDLKSTVPDSRSLGFALAPRINAAGRLEHADIALQLLVTNDYSEAITLANRLEEINHRRRDMTDRIVSEAREQAELLLDRKVLVVSNPDWQKGLVGIVAGKLAEQYRRPVFVLERGEIEATGSVRTSGEFDVVAALKSAALLLTRFGGHKQAAGLTLPSNKLDEFYSLILKYAEENPLPESEPVLPIDAELREEDLTLDGLDQITQLEPFGAGNPKPRFMVRNATLTSSRLVGNDQKHLQMQVLVGERTIDCIAFNMGYWADKLTLGSRLDLAGELIGDTWQGTKKLKLKLIDIAPHEQKEVDYQY
jgi:single-stranded-DNA-specific exonuclease